MPLFLYLSLKCYICVVILEDMTNKEINRLGDRIAYAQSVDLVNRDDLDLLQEFRKTYKDPLAKTFNRLLILARKVDKGAIVTYRIKRINTIIRKLQRFKDNPNGEMKLSRMWDIAGCRCILSTTRITDIYKLKSLIEKEFGECKVNDYLSQPKGDGYQSLHMYITDEETGKKIEVQIRNLVQHHWATLVEIVDLIYGTKIKEGQQEKKLKEFLLLFSRKESLSYEEKERLVRIEGRYRIFKRMSSVFSGNYINVRKQWLATQGVGNYFVIEADKNFKSEIESFKNFDKAEDSYYERYLANKDSNIVLTYIKNARFEQISTAYSNYILTVHSFFDDYRRFIEEMILDSVDKQGFWRLNRSLRLYCRNTLVYMKNVISERRELERSIKNKGISNRKAKEWMNTMISEIKQWNSATVNFMKRLVVSIRHRKKYVYLVRCHFWLMRIESGIQ